VVHLCPLLGPVHEYKQPFEEEVGLHPNIEQMKEAVVGSRLRPKMPKGWDCVQVNVCLPSCSPSTCYTRMWEPNVDTFMHEGTAW
jgi:hypothetical protein